MMAAMASIGIQGHVRTKTLPAFTMEEIEDITQQMT